MKIKNIIHLIIPILFLGCTNTANKKNISVVHFDSGFTLYQDTIIVNINGEMTHALKHRDKFYVLFEQQVIKYGGYGKRWLYIFSNGQLEKIIDCPKKMETVYLDFYAKNDSLILKPYMDNQCYFLDLKNYQWNEIEKTDDLIFEDEKFQVYSLDFGEWGGKTWFKDKKSGQEYILEVTTPLVNKIDSVYYLSNSFQVLKIRNPQLLNKCNDDITYKNIKSTGKFYTWYGKPIGFVYVYKDTTYNYFENKFRPHIVSSFVLNNELLHICETDTSAYIARHKGYSIKPIQKILDNISFYNWYYSYRCSNLYGKNELLKFRSKNGQAFGLLEMIDHEIHVTYFKNIALLEPKLLGAEKADSIFVNRLNSIIPNFRNLEICTIDSKEQTWGTFDITPNHNIGVSNNWNPNNYTIDTCRSYLIREDSIFSNSIIYFGTKDSNLVRVVLIDWNYKRNLMESDSEENAKKTFDNKTEFLINHISEKIGKQIENNDEKNFIRRTWETPSGIKLDLSYNKEYYGVRLMIYEK